MAYIDDVYLVVNIAPVGIPTYVRLSQNENGRRLYFAVAGGEIPSGSTATMSGTKPDGVVYSKAGTVSGNTVIFSEDIQLTAVAGEWPAKIVIVNGGQTIMTARIRFVIDADTVAAGAVPSDSQLEGLVAQAAAYAEAAKDGAFYGSPLVASTAAEMTDKTRVYVYTGSESGYTSGNWYYWDGSAWTSGGVYNATAVSTDTTLSIAGKAADAKVVGDEIADLKGDIDDISTGTDNLNTAGAGRYYVQASGNIVPSTENYFGMSAKVPCTEETTYTVRFFGATAQNGKTTVYAAWYAADGTFISRESLFNTPADRLYRTFTSPNGAGMMYFDAYNNIGGLELDADASIMIIAGADAPQEFIKPLTAEDIKARTDVEALKVVVDGIIDDTGDTYPDYFQSNLDAAVNRIRENMGVVGVGGDSFIFMTDSHWGINQKHSPALVKYLLNNTEIRNVVCGGDALDSGEKADELVKGYDFMRAFAFVPGGLKYVVGNHDNNVNQHSDDSNYWLTSEQVYSIFYPKSEMEWKEIRSTSGLVKFFRIFGYFDVPATKTRYINVGAPFGDIQTSAINWAKALIEEDTATNIIIIAHYLYHPTTGFTTDAQALIDMCDAHTNVKAIIFGHIHADIVKYSASGIPLISTDTDAAGRLGSLNPNTATVGTITEQAFDAMTVNYSNRDVYCARVGRGKNRRINGGLNALASGGTLTLTANIAATGWATSDATIATVSGGVVTAVGSGTAVITASDSSDEETWCISVA